MKSEIPKSKIRKCFTSNKQTHDAAKTIICKFVSVVIHFYFEIATVDMCEYASQLASKPAQPANQTVLACMGYVTGR